jgi:hypothetical protein
MVPMARLPQQPLSIHRSFVVRLYPETQTSLKAGSTSAGAARLAGRVEHVVSGEAQEFRSVKELVQFFNRWLRHGVGDRP